MSVYSYCVIHRTYPKNNEPCWQCVNKAVEKETADLQAANAALYEENETLRKDIQQFKKTRTENIMAIGMVRAWLKVNGYDGLYTEDCGCEVDDLMPCGEFGGRCEPGYKASCPGEETCENAAYNEPCDWHISGVKP